MPSPRLYPPDWCDAETAAYLVSLHVDTFKRHVEAGLLPRPVSMGGKHLWSRVRLTEALEALDTSTVDPIEAKIRGTTPRERHRASP